MKKRLIPLLLVLALILGLTACGDGNGADTGGGTSGGGSAMRPTGEDVVLFGGDDDYRIVYSGTATSALKELVLQMTERVKDTTGAEPKRTGDNSKTEKETEREILFAATDRAESDEGMEKISGIGYRVEFIGEKLVITASNDTVLKRAVERLFEAWTADDGRIVLNSGTLLTEDMSDSMVPLYENGQFRFRIVIQASAASEVHDSAEELAGRISALVGKSLEVVYDGMVSESEGTCEILLGETNRQASKTLYSSFENAYAYKVVLEDGYIAVGSKYTASLVRAISKLADDICSAISGCYCGIPAIVKDYSLSGSVSEKLLSFKEPDAGALKGISSIADDEYVLYYENVAKNDYQTYVDKLKSDGYKVEETYRLGNNEYTLMTHESFDLYAAYLAKVGAMRIVLNKPDTLWPEAASPSKSSVCTPALWQLEVDSKGSGANGGMSYVIQLSDGSFIVVDGGYKTDTEADNLYSLLKANTKGGGEPVISAWLITHLHSDHWGCLGRFSQKYKDRVQVKAFYYNFPGVGMSDITVSAKNNVEAYMKGFTGAKLYGRLHSGMNFSVADAKLTVLCAYEDVFPQVVENGNDTCTVFKVNVGGSDILFLGDAYFKQSSTMTSQLEATVLKSDIVQFSHHGYEGCSDALYKMVNAPTVLWPMPIVGYEGSVKNVFKSWYNNNLGANKYVRTNSAVKKVIVSGAGTEKLELPYTPSGDKVPDYEEIFTERTKSDS